MYLFYFLLLDFNFIFISFAINFFFSYLLVFIFKEEFLFLSFSTYLVNFSSTQLVLTKFFDLFTLYVFLLLPTTFFLLPFFIFNLLYFLLPFVHKDFVARLKFLLFPVLLLVSFIFSFNFLSFLFRYVSLFTPKYHYVLTFIFDFSPFAFFYFFVLILFTISFLLFLPQLLFYITSSPTRFPTIRLTLISCVIIFVLFFLPSDPFLHLLFFLLFFFLIEVLLFFKTIILSYLSGRVA